MTEFERPELKQRDPQYKATDTAAVRAIAQAAVNVELFTIPLYMVAMYSLQGMHQITSKGNDFYRGRLWPGSAAAPNPDEAPNPDNARAFNLLYSVFIDEMLHLQLASNIAKALGVTPTFTSESLQTKSFGWRCYGPEETRIPHIIDFRDAVEEYQSIRVKLDALSPEQNRLFVAIEQNENDARSVLRPEKADDYFPTVPFDWWQPTYKETDLRMFGSIGSLYKCLWEYIEIEYTDGTNLFETVFNRGTLERDLFNYRSSVHKPEYPKMRSMASGEISVRDAKENILDMINAITDQGEGGGVAEWIRANRVGPHIEYEWVEKQFQPDHDALEYNNPNYTDTGKLHNPSGPTTARGSNADRDHHARFLAIGEILNRGHVMTWDRWHAEGNQWTEDMLKTDGYDENRWKLPPAKDVAAALNALKADGEPCYELFSQVAAGAIAGITRVLNAFWMAENTGFPNPSMYGSGDRVSICWAIFGKYPDLARGIREKTAGKLYHACQGLDLVERGDHGCAPPEVFHSCRGSNGCKAESGCGFVQIVGHSALCGFKAVKDHLQPTRDVPGAGLLYSAPSDNRCATCGGCAIPISASQRYPLPDATHPDQTTGQMELCDFTGEKAEPQDFGQMKFTVGEPVYEAAWRAYVHVLKHRGVAEPAKPEKASNLRLALPPST